MPTKPSDPLLAAGKVITVVLMAIIAIATVVLVGLVPALLLNQAEFAAEISMTSSSNLTTITGITIALLLIIASVTAISFHFFQLLDRIIDTVGAGDPLTLENAARLNRMGWIALIFQAATLPISALAAYLRDLLPTDELSVDFQFSLTGVLLALVLFILARVFKHGAQMREDLEGTV